MMYSFSNVHTKVIPLVETASKIAKQYFENGLPLEKKDSVQLSTAVVTVADKEIEDFIKSSLQVIFPETGFIGEESSIEDVKEYNWILDPIDGTLNFGSGIPLFGISLALWHKDEPIYAITVFPCLNESVWAYKNEGIFLNGEKIDKKTWPTDKKTVLYSHVGMDETKIAVFTQLMNKQIALPRYLASTVYSGAAVSLRKAHSIICINNAVWDIAAIVLFMREAGLEISWISHKPSVEKIDQLKEYTWSLVAGEKETVSQIISAIAQMKF